MHKAFACVGHSLVFFFVFFCFVFGLVFVLNCRLPLTLILYVLKKVFQMSRERKVHGMNMKRNAWLGKAKEKVWWRLVDEQFFFSCW